MIGSVEGPSTCRAGSKRRRRGWAVGRRRPSTKAGLPFHGLDGTARQGRGGAAYKATRRVQADKGPPGREAAFPFGATFGGAGSLGQFCSLATAPCAVLPPPSRTNSTFHTAETRRIHYGQHPPPTQLGTTARRDARATRTSTRRIYLTSSMSPAHTVSFSRRSSPRFVILRFPQAPTSTVALRLVGGGLPPHGPTMGLAGGVGRGVRSSSTKTPSASRCLRSHGSVMHVLPS